MDSYCSCCFAAEKIIDIRKRAEPPLYVVLEQRMSGGLGSPEAQTEGLLTEWTMLARHTKRVHGAASTYYRKWADTSMIMTNIT